MSRQEIEITGRSKDDGVVVSEGAVEIQAQGRPISGQLQRQGTVHLVIDCSGSMAGGKLDQAKRGALDFATEAREKGYSVGVIQFGSYAALICEPQREIAILRDKLQQMEIIGSTNMAEGIQLASEQLGGKEGPCVIVIVTDGHPDSRQDAVRAAQQAKQRGIDIITIGTKDADRRFLAELASAKELSVSVSNSQLRQGIASTAKMLRGV